MDGKDRLKLFGIALWKYSWIGRKYGGRGTFDKTSQLVWGILGIVFLAIFVFIFWATHQ